MPTIGGQEDAVCVFSVPPASTPLDQIGFCRRISSGSAPSLKNPTASSSASARPVPEKPPLCIRALADINTPDRKIWTAEDPVEITQDGLRQVQVHPKIGFTFAEALRSFLRADPDVIMVGEMRDTDTAKTAIGPRSPATWCSAPCIPTAPRKRWSG